MPTLSITYLNHSNEPLLQEAFKFTIHKELIPYHEETFTRCFAKGDDAIIRDSGNVWIIAYSWQYQGKHYYANYEIEEEE